jgi:hypothetical protein
MRSRMEINWERPDCGNVSHLLLGKLIIFQVVELFLFAGNVPATPVARRAIPDNRATAASSPLLESKNRKPDLHFGGNGTIHIS